MCTSEAYKPFLILRRAECKLGREADLAASLTLCPSADGHLRLRWQEYENRTGVLSNSASCMHILMSNKMVEQWRTTDFQGKTILAGLLRIILKCFFFFFFFKAYADYTTCLPYVYSSNLYV